MPPAGSAGKRHSHMWLAGAVCALLALAATWLVLPVRGSTSADNRTGDGSSSTASDGSNGTPLWGPTSPDPDVATPTQDPPSEPTAVRVSIPSIGVDSSLVPLALDPVSGSLTPPQRYDVAGVFAAGPVPGQVGPAVIAGHVDSRTGPAVFYRLEEILPGAEIGVTLSDGQEITFRAVEVAPFPKNAFPTDRVYGPTPSRELRLITCGGVFDRSRRSYLDNIVVFATGV